MGLLSYFKRNAEAPRPAAANVSEPGDAVQRARTRARQRLIGAVVLLGIGIIGFPLVFETQPRPIPVNIPIETPAKDGAPALTMPPARTPAAAPSTAAAVSPSAAPAAQAKPAPSEVITESREDAGRDVPAASAPVATPKPAAAASKPATTTAAAKPVEAKPVEAKPEAKPAAPKPTEAARAQALLDGKQAKAADKADKASDAGRFVVQVGAFADAGAARETRLKVEKLGLKTYTQVAATSAGNRIRVRAGPFTSRAEADKALAKARAAGLTAVVLTL